MIKIRIINSIVNIIFTSLTNGRGSWVVGRGYKSWVVGVGVGVGVGVSEESITMINMNIIFISYI